MQFQVTTEKTYDGIDAKIPSIRECQSWGKTEDEALANLFERAAFFLKLPARFKHILDRSRVEDGITYYTLVIKSH